VRGVAKDKRRKPLLIPACGRWNFHFYPPDESLTSLYDLFRPPLSKKAKGRLSLTLDHLAQKRKNEWSRPQASPLGHSKYVIRFKDENNAQKRLFGHFYDDHDAFVVTLSGCEKDDRYYPVDYDSRSTDYKVICDANFNTETIPVENRCIICQSN